MHYINILRYEKNQINYGEKRVVQEGKDGEKSVISIEIYHGDDLIDTKFVEEKIDLNNFISFE